METLFRFGQYRVDAQARQLHRDGAPVALEPRPFDLLVHLLRHRRRVVPKQELFERVWPDTAASDSALARAVMKLRQALGTPEGEAAVRTVARVGYRFVAALEGDLPDRHDAAAAEPALTIALLPVDNATADSSLAWLELGVMALATRHLEAHPGLQPVSIPSLLTAVDAAGAAGGAAVADAVRRATGARVVVRSRVTRAPDGGLRLAYEARGASSVRGVVHADRPAELAARWTDALARALCPAAPPPAPPATPHDPLAEEAFARGVQALTAHRWVKAAHLFHLALDLAPDHAGAQLELLRALGNLGDAAMLPLAQRLLERAGCSGDVMLAARVHQALGRLHLNRSELAQADHHLGHSLQLAAGRGGADWTARTLMLLASTAISRLDHAQAREVVVRMLEQCDRSGDRILRVAGLNIEAIATAAGGDLEGAVALSIDAARRARELHVNSYLVDACDNAAWYLAKLGRLTEAAVHAQESVAAASAFDATSHAWDSTPVLCWIYRLARTPQAAAEALARLPDPAGVARPEHVWRAHALIAAAEGRHAEAADGLDRAMRRHRELEQGYDEEQTLPWLIDALVRCGRLDDAEAELAAAAAPHLAGSADLRAQMLHAHALLAHARGRVDEAKHWLAQLVDAGAAPLWRAWACIDLAWLEAEAGHVDAAASLLDRVPDALADHPLVHAARARLRAAADAADATMAPAAFLPTRL